MDVLSQSALLVAVVSFGLGASVLYRDLRNKLFVAFAILCLSICGWALFYFLEQLLGGGFYYRLHLGFHLLLSPVGLYLMQVMIRVRDRFTRNIFLVSALGCGGLMMMLFLGLERLVVIRALMDLFPEMIALQILHLMGIDGRLKRGFRRIPPTTIR